MREGRAWRRSCVIFQLAPPRPHFAFFFCRSEGRAWRRSCVIFQLAPPTPTLRVLLLFRREGRAWRRSCVIFQLAPPCPHFACFFCSGGRCRAWRRRRGGRRRAGDAEGRGRRTRMNLGRERGRGGEEEELRDFSAAAPPHVPTLTSHSSWSFFRREGRGWARSVRLTA